MQRRKLKPFNAISLINLLFISLSILLCIILMLVDIPGMKLLEINPNWLLIWVVAYSLKKTVCQGAIAGIIMGCIYDGITSGNPSHIFSFVLIGIFTSSLKTHKYLGEDFISVAFVVFFMSIFSEAVYAWQYGREYFMGLGAMVEKYRQGFIVSAVITSLWSPALYYPMSLWQKRVKLLQKKAHL